MLDFILLRLLPVDFACNRTRLCAVGLFGHRRRHGGLGPIRS